MSKAKWPDAENKWDITSCIEDGVMINKHLLANIEDVFKNRDNLMVAFSWVTTKEGHDFWNEMYYEGSDEGNTRLHQMKKELIEAKPFKKEDWI